MGREAKDINVWELPEDIVNACFEIREEEREAYLQSLEDGEEPEPEE